MLPHPSHPVPNVRDDRETPLVQGRETARGFKDDLPDGANEIFSAKGLDSGISVDRVQEIRRLAQGHESDPEIETVPTGECFFANAPEIVAAAESCPTQRK